MKFHRIVTPASALCKTFAPGIYRQLSFSPTFALTMENVALPFSAGNHRLALFASGTGTNAQQIIRHFAGHPSISVELIVCNKSGAGVLAIAESAGIPTLLIEKEAFFRGDSYLPQLAQRGITFIVLAGFLWKVPPALIAAYPRRIINIHPALLPAYGGKGMYGTHVHEAVIQNKEAESGITIHYVDEHYDKGDIIFQTSCPVLPGDTPDALASRVHALEHQHFPAVIERILTGQH